MGSYLDCCASKRKRGVDDILNDDLNTLKPGEGRWQVNSGKHKDLDMNDILEGKKEDGEEREHPMAIKERLEKEDRNAKLKTKFN